MKKMFSIALVCMMLLMSAFPAAGAEGIDLNQLSFDELKALQIRLNAEIFSRPEWKEVTVPAGTWTVGEDIPVGEYSVTLPKKIVATNFVVYEKPNGRSKYNTTLMDGNRTIGKIILTEGNIVELKAEIIFAPPVLLGF